MPSSVALASIFVVAQAALTSAAAPTPVRLESNVTECPSRVDVHSALQQVLGDGPWSTAGWVLAYRRDPSAGNVDGDRSLLVEVVDPAGQRLAERRISVATADCPALAGAMAAVVERSLRTLGWTRGEPLPMSAQPPSIPEPPQPREPTAPPAPRERPPRVVLGAGPLLGTSPRTGANLLLEARVRAVGPVCLQLGGGLLSGSESQRAGAGMVQVSRRWFTLAPLAALVFGRAELAGGPSVLFGLDHGSSSNLAQGASGDRATLAVGAMLGAALRLSPRWRISAKLEAFRAALGADFVAEIGGRKTVVLASPSWIGMGAVSLEFLAWP